MNSGGTYILVMGVDGPVELTIGRLGVRLFEAGWYTYAGSGLNGLEGRIRRHLRPEKRVHWHIDYLLEAARLEEIWYVYSDKRYECSWYGAASAMPGAGPAIEGFGSSDCGCRSHLVRLEEKPALPEFNTILARRGLPMAAFSCPDSVRMAAGTGRDR